MTGQVSIIRQLGCLLTVAVLAPPLNVSAQEGQQQESPVKLSARFHIETGTDRGFLIVKAVVPDGNHIYSLTQPKPLIPTRLTVKSTPRFIAEKKFKSDKKPTVIERDPLFNARLEKHVGTVQFFVPVKVDASEGLKNLQPRVLFSGQMCSDQGYCVPINDIEVRAQFAGYFQREAKNSVPPLKQKK